MYQNQYDIMGMEESFKHADIQQAMMVKDLKGMGNAYTQWVFSDTGTQQVK